MEGRVKGRVKGRVGGGRAPPGVDQSSGGKGGQPQIPAITANTLQPGVEHRAGMTPPFPSCTGAKAVRPA